jgi:hypothetical protein
LVPDLDETPAMRRSLGAFRREVGGDGLVRDELVSALAVALHADPPKGLRVW